MPGLFQAVADAAVAIARQYKDTSIGLAKIEAARAYLKGAESARKSALGAAAAACGAMALQGMILAGAAAILMFAPWHPGWRFAAAAGAIAVSWGAVFGVAAAFLSQKKWMRYTKSDRVVATALNGHARSARVPENQGGY